MANEFDLTSFLNSQADVEAGVTPAFDPIDYTPRAGLDMIGSQKVLDLDLANQRATRNVENALVDKLGLEADSALGTVVNDGASLFSGLTRVAGNLATLPIDAITQIGQATVPDDVISAYTRRMTGEDIQEGDDALLDAIAPGTEEGGVPQTYFQRMQGLQGLRDVSKNIADTFDFSSIVNTDRRDELSDDIRESTAAGVANIREGYESGDLLQTGKGVAQTIGNALVSGVTNPGAVAEYAAENLPQLAAVAANPALGVATNAGYGFNELREGYTDYAAEHKGALPPAADRNKMALFAASAVLAEQVGDMSMLRGFTKAAKTSGVGSAAKGVAGAMTKEGITEGYQTFAEGQAHLEDRSLEEIVEAATIGAMVGGTYHGAMELANTGRAQMEASEQRVATEAAFTTAVESGDVTALSDMESPTYDPVRAVQALQETIKGGDEVAVQEAVAKSDEIQQDLAKEVSQLEVMLQTFEPEAVADVAARREALVANQGDEAEIARYDAFLERAAEFTPETIQGMQEYHAELSQKLVDVRAAAEQFQVAASPEADEVAAIAQQASAGDTNQADRLLTLTMINPNSVDTAVASTLAESESLSPEQRTAFKAFQAAQVAADNLQTIEGVRSDITTGGDGFKGVPQYRNAIRMALAQGNEAAARSQLEGISKFAASRQSKAAAITAAYEQVKGTGNSVYLAPDAKGQWAPVPAQVDGGIVVDGRSFKLRDAVSSEAEYLARVADAFTALVNAAPSYKPAQATAAVVQAPTVVQEAPQAGVAPVVEAQPQSGQVNVEQVAPVVEPVAEPVVETGELTAIRNKPQEEVTADNYRQLNLVGALFEQNPGKDTDASQKPLVKVADFAAKVKTDPSVVYEYLDQRKELSQPQKTAVARFFKFNTWADSKIREQFKVKNQDFRFVDLAQYLVNDDGSLDENVVTATSYSMFTWANESATQVTNTDESINAILMRDLDEDISNTEYAVLGRVGTREAFIAAQLGQRIVQALGLRANAQASESEVARLESSLGQRAINAMVSLGIAERIQVPDTQLQPLMKTGATPDAKLQHTFIRVKAEQVDGKWVAVRPVQLVREASTGSQSVLSKLFGTEESGVEPSYTPVPFTQQTAKRTNQDVPKVLASILEKEGKKAHVVRQDMYQLWGNLSQQALYEIAGVVDSTDTPTHVENRASREAKNDGLKAQVDNFSVFVTKMVNDPSTNGLEQELFFGRSVWKPQRVGLTANVINPQTSKVHRHMIKMAGWNATIDMTDKAQLDNFKLRVIEAFDEKTESKATDLVLQGYDQLVNRPGVQDAVTALAEILRGEANDTLANEQKILAGVRATGNNFHGLDALVALAHQHNAVRNGATTFDTELMGEVDGLTNGPMLSLLMLGAKGWDTLNQGGFFSLEQEFTQFNDYKGLGNLDLYEGTIAETLKRLGSSQVQLMDALQLITGKLQNDDGRVTSKGRKIIKQPLTAMMFGSNTKTAVQGMADGFIETIYSSMEDYAGNRDEAGMKQLLGAVNTLMRNKAPKLNVNLGYDLALNTKLTEQQKRAIKDTFYDLIGKPTEDALGDTYATFLARRDTINQTAQLAWSLYDAAERAVTAYVMDNSPDVPRRKQDGEMRPLRALTKAQQAEVKRILGDMEPVLQTALSKASNQPSAGMHMSKSVRSLDSSQPYQSDITFGVPVPTFDLSGKPVQVRLRNGEYQFPGSTKNSGLRRQNVDPGVMPFITSIHSSDSMIASSVYGKMEALNVHDALGVDLNDVATVGQNLNQATYQTMLDYSAPTAMAEMLDHVLLGMGRLMADPELAARIQPLLAEVMAQRGDKKRGNFTEQLLSIRHVAEQADTDKLNYLASMRAVGQYATEGGSYIVTDADRAAARDALAKVGSTLSEDAVLIAESLDEAAKAAPADLQPSTFKQLSSQSVTTLQPATSLNALDKAKVENPAVRAALEQNKTLHEALGTVPAAEAADIIEAVNNVTATANVWGELGRPVVDSDQNLVDLLAGTEMTAGQLAQAVGEYAQDPFTKKVLAMASRSLRNMPVVYVTPTTPVDGVLGAGVDKSRGWYAQQGNREAIYVKSPDFVESGITTEMLTHELVHAALAQLVEQHTGTNTQVGREVARLEELRTKAAEFIGNNGPLSAKYANATGNVHELLAWGLTNQDFQREVLAAITLPARAKGMLSGLRDFIQSLTAMLFGGRVNEASAMGQLVASGAYLFKAAAETKTTRDNLTLRYEDAVNHVNAMTAAQVFDGLAALSKRQSPAAHQEFMRSIMADLVEPLYGPYGAFKADAAANKASTPMDVYLKALDTGKRPFGSQALTHEFVLNAQEAYVLESVEASVLHAMENPATLFVRDALGKLYAQARAELKPRNFHNGDWNTATDAEQKLAEAKYEFLFKARQNAGGKNEYLARFAALGLASNEVNNVLNFATPDATVPLKTLSWGGAIMELFRRAMTVLASLHTKVRAGDMANTALATLLDQLVDIEAKRKDRLAKQKVNGLDSVEIALGAVGTRARETIDALGQSNFFRQSSSPLVKFVGVAASTLAADRVTQVLDHMTKVRDAALKSKHGTIMGIVSEMRGSHDGNIVATALFKEAKKNEQERKHHIEYTVAQVNEAFADGGANLEPQHRAALTRVFLRTNAAAIADVLGTAGLKELMEDPAKMAAHRRDLEAQVIAAEPEALYMISQTKDLAHHKVVGGSTSSKLMLNTLNIANLTGTAKVGQAQQAAVVKPLLDQLLAVYALEYTGTADKKLAMEVFRTESNRGAQNGVDFILKLHSGLQKKSGELLFKGQETMQASAYVPEITDTNIEVMLVDKADLGKYERAGYVLGTNLQHDPASGVRDNRVLVTRRGSGQAGLLTGAMSYTGMGRKGSSPSTEALNVLQGTQVTSAAHKAQINAAKAAVEHELFARSLAYDPRKAKRGNMVPVLAPNGQIADWRYMMSETSRDALLDRDNSVEQVLGVLSGQIVDKVSSAAQNADVVRSLRDQYDADFKNRPASYLVVGKDSTDPELRELYTLLPESTKREIKRVWKDDNMRIPADQLNLIMGYRKYSLTQPFTALPGDRNFAEKLFVQVAEHFLGDKAALRIGKAEDVMQELVKETKDILVVKNIVTLVGNMISNLTLLAWEGVPVRKAIAAHAIGLKAAVDYRRDNKRLLQLQQAVEIGYADSSVAEGEIVELRDRLARNPLKPLIDAGLMPTIVEDVEADDSQYSYKSRLQTKVQKYTNKVPAWMREVGKQVYMTHDTGIYKFLSQATQLSDLVARYAMYEHTMTRARDPLSQADALKQAEESFVNYDLPSHRNIQFLNDMGLVMFTKYYMRIQKTIMRLVREKPARGLALVAANHAWSGLDSITDSYWMNKLGNNPLQDGALGYFGALDELPAFSLLK